MTPFIKTGLSVAAGVGAMVLAFGIGAGATSAKVVEKVVEKPVDKIVTRNVEVTPASCLTYITLTDQLLGYLAESDGYARDAIQAAGHRDTAGLQDYIDKMAVLTPKVEAMVTPITAAKDQCRRPTT